MSLKSAAMRSQNIGYIRISDSDEFKAKQLDGVPLDMLFEDYTALFSEERLQLKECLKALNKGDTLHVHSMDRLATSMGNFYEIFEDLMSRGITVKLHSENIEVSNDVSPAGFNGKTVWDCLKSVLLCSPAIRKHIKSKVKARNS